MIIHTDHIHSFQKDKQNERAKSGFTIVLDYKGENGDRQEISIVFNGKARRQLVEELKDSDLIRV